MLQRGNYLRSHNTSRCVCIKGGFGVTCCPVTNNSLLPINTLRPDPAARDELQCWTLCRGQERWEKKKHYFWWNYMQVWILFFFFLVILCNLLESVYVSFVLVWSALWPSCFSTLCHAASPCQSTTPKYNRTSVKPKKFSTLSHITDPWCMISE